MLKPPKRMGILAADVVFDRNHSYELLVLHRYPPSSAIVTKINLITQYILRGRQMDKDPIILLFVAFCCVFLLLSIFFFIVGWVNVVGWLLNFLMPPKKNEDNVLLEQEQLVPKAPSVTKPEAPPIQREPPKSNVPSVPPPPAAPSSPTPKPEPIPPQPKSPRFAPIRFQLAKIKRIWKSLSNIELTLFLGATLLFIGAVIFASSKGGQVIFTFFALTLLVGGEMVIRRSEQKVVGETFRALGFLLIPFIVLTFNNSVLSESDFVKNKPSLLVFLQMILSGGVAAFYYVLYRFTSTNRSTAYLASFSLGFFILFLPKTLEAWRAPGLIFMATCLFMAARQLEPDGRKLLQWPKSPKVSALAESHFIIGGVYVLLSWGALTLYLETLTSTETLAATTVYFTLHTLLLAGLSFWFRDARLAGGAAFVSGLALVSSIQFFFNSDWVLFAGWNGLAVLLFVLAPRIAHRQAGSLKILTTMSLFWSGAAFVYAFIVGEGTNLLKIIAQVAKVSQVGEGTPLVAIASLGLTMAFVASATRFRRDWLLWPAFVLLHLAIFAMLAPLLSEWDLSFVQTMIWLGLAALWLTTKPDVWQRRFVTYAFVVEAMWVLLYTSLVVGDSATVLAGLLLTLGWIQWSRKEQKAVGVAVAIAQGVYTLFAIARYWPLPQEALLFMTFTVGTFLTFLPSRLPKYAQQPTYLGGLFLLFVAPITGAIGTLIGAGESYWPFENDFPQQAILTLSIGVYALETKRRQSAWLVAPTTVLGYILVGSVTASYLPLSYFMPLGLIQALILYWIAPRAPKPSDNWLDNLALATPFVTRLTFFLMLFVMLFVFSLIGPKNVVEVVEKGFFDLKDWWDLSLLTLLLTVVFYAWQAKRRQSGGLALLATAHAYYLVWSFTVKFLPAGAAPFAVLALALLLLRIAPLVPAQRGQDLSSETKIRLNLLWSKFEAVIVNLFPSENIYAILLDRLALVTIFLAPLAGLVVGIFVKLFEVKQFNWVFTTSEVAKSFVVDGNRFIPALQVALFLATMLYGWQAHRRDSNLLTLGTTFLAYTLVAWLAVHHELSEAAYPFVALALSVLTLLAAQDAPGGSERWLDPLAMGVAFVGPFVSMPSVEYTCSYKNNILFQSIDCQKQYFGQFSLLLSALFFGGRGWQAKKSFRAISGFQFYMLYVWIADLITKSQDIEIYRVALYTVPLSLLFLAYSQLFSNRRQAWEALAMITLLGPTIKQADESDFYWKLLLFFGLLLLGVGASFSRQVLTIAGTLTLLVFGLLAVRLSDDLPTWLIVGMVGAGLMIIAILLIWWGNRRSFGREAVKKGPKRPPHRTSRHSKPPISRQKRVLPSGPSITPLNPSELEQAQVLYNQLGTDFDQNQILVEKILFLHKKAPDNPQLGRLTLNAVVTLAESALNPLQSEEKLHETLSLLNNLGHLLCHLSQAERIKAQNVYANLRKALQELRMQDKDSSEQ